MSSTNIGSVNPVTDRRKQVVALINILTGIQNWRIQDIMELLATMGDDQIFDLWSVLHHLINEEAKGSESGIDHGDKPDAPQPQNQ